MQLKYTDLLAVKSTGLLPVFAYALIAAVLLSGGTGAWAGWKLRGASAVAAENARLQADIAALHDAAEAIRDGAIENDRRFGEAAARQARIATTWETEREEQRRFNEQQRTRLAALLADRPDLRSARAGDDVLRHWRASNAGATAEAAAAGAAVEPGAGVPGAAAAGGRPVGDADRKPRRRRRALPRVRGEQGTADRRGARVAADGVGLVLRSGPPRRRRGRELCA